jgi:hypothetical protein
MKRPPLPTATELQRVEDVSPGGAGRLLDLYCTAWQSHERRTNVICAEQRLHASHLRQYRCLSVLSGMTLAIGSLGLCAYGIEHQANLLPLACVLGPVTGLAGIFIWGYRPRQHRPADQLDDTANALIDHGGNQ